MAKKLVSIHAECGNTLLQLCATTEDRTISTPTVLDASMVDSTAEEADQKLVRHTLHCLIKKYTVIEVQSIDNNFLVLLLAYVAMELESTNNTFNLFFKMFTPSPKWYDIIHVITGIGISICKVMPFFYCFNGCDTNLSFNGKGMCSFFDAWMMSERKNELIKTFVRLGHMPESTESVNIFNVPSLVKDVYFGASHDKTKSLNSLRKEQFVQSTSNDLKKLAPGSDSLYMQILRATHIIGFEWLECAKNILVPGPSLRGFIQKGRVYVLLWLPSPRTFDLKGFVQTCKCKKEKCASCKCHQLKIYCLRLCHCNRNCQLH